VAKGANCLSFFFLWFPFLFLFYRKKKKRNGKSNTNLLFISPVKESLAALTGLCLLNTCNNSEAVSYETASGSLEARRGVKIL
jgi:hypothetical protein